MNDLVYGHDLTKNSSYCRPGIDTLKISALVENPNSHQISSKVYIKNLSGSFIDSLSLIKTGMLNNSEIWKGSYIAPDSEGFFSISLSAKDITDSKTWTTDNISRFTTAGPVVVDSVSFMKMGNLYYFRPFVKNQSKTETIRNAKMNIECNDPWVTNVTGVNLSDIPPDSTVGSSTWGVIHYVDSLFSNTFNLKFEIMSDGWAYWTDSTRAIVTGVNNKTPLPLAFKLEQNYPNPFNPTTTIRYSIPKQSFVTLIVYDILGREIIKIVNEEKQAGNYQVEFSPVSGIQNLASGIYFYQIKAGDYVCTKKMILLK